MSKPTLVIMAAGMGSRFGGIKQIEPVGPNGEIIIDYSIYDAIRAGFGKVVFIIRRQIEEAFREKVGRGIEKRIDTEYVFQELSALPSGFSVPAGREKPWGTGHAILMCKDAVKTPFCVINADDFYGAGSYKAMCASLASAKDEKGVYSFYLAGYVLKNTLSDHGHVARGICAMNKDGYLEEIHERTKIQKFGSVVKFEEGENNWIEVSAEATVSMNMWGLTPGLFNELERLFPVFLKEKGAALKSEFFIPEIVGQLLNAGKARVKVLSTGEKWFGVTYKEDKPLFEKAIREQIRQNVYPERLWN